VTPYVVKTPQDLARMSVDERGRYNLSPSAFTEKDMNRYLDAPPPGGVTDGLYNNSTSPHERH
jgi:hypothetical protein